VSPVIAIVIGLSAGAGLLLVASGLRPRPTPLVDFDAILARAGVSVAASQRPTQAAAAAGVRARLGRSGVHWLARLRVDVDELGVQLRVLDKALEQHVYEKLLAAAAGFCVPVLMGVGIALADVAVSPVAVAAGAVVLSAAGFFYPDLPLAERVEARRREFRHSLSSFLDLVTIIMAGGGGIESALTGAADAGDGWAFEELRDALRRARMTRRTPWDTLTQLGDDLQIRELTELAAAVSLAGGHGARVKESLIAKADSLRDALAAETEAAAESQTEKMILPVMLMILGLVLFIGFGAVDAISTPATDIVVVENP
jgi:tight adherence protein C